MQNCFPKGGTRLREETSDLYEQLVLFHKEQGQTDSSRTNMLTSYKTDYDYLSPIKYPFPKGRLPYWLSW